MEADQQSRGGRARPLDPLTQGVPSERVQRDAGVLYRALQAGQPHKLARRPAAERGSEGNFVKASGCHT